ncbi:hypothetical protein [Dactylosporangium cerinum]
MLVLTVALAVLAAVCTAVIFGTDVLGAVVMRPAYAEIDDQAMVQIVGRSHRLGGQRLPVPGVVSVVAAALTTLSALIAGWLAAGLAAAVGLVLLLAWLVIFNRISLPINKVLIAASEAGETPPTPGRCRPAGTRSSPCARSCRAPHWSASAWRSPSPGAEGGLCVDGCAGTCGACRNRPERA